MAESLCCQSETITTLFVNLLYANTELYVFFFKNTVFRATIVVGTIDQF